MYVRVCVCMCKRTYCNNWTKKNIMYYVKYEGIEFRFQASKSEPVGSKTTGLGGSEINRQSENDSYSGGKGGNLVPVVDPLSLNREGEKKSLQLFAHWALLPNHSIDPRPSCLPVFPLHARRPRSSEQ